MPRPPEERVKEHAEALRRAEEQEAHQALADRKRSYFAMCAGFGMKTQAIERAWVKYLRDGKT